MPCRGVPFFVTGKDGRPVFFLFGGKRGMQLGAEGFIVGTGYLLFSALIALLTYGVPRLRSGALRSTTSYGLAAAAVYVLLNLAQVCAACLKVCLVGRSAHRQWIHSHNQALNAGRRAGYRGGCATISHLLAMQHCSPT
jgi:hypothetical protein